ncbi:MAG: signal peptidase I [Deltaproteobacteria bacterium]|nr:signal peptidase I [Deltaproteobacteria bacterium]
MFLFQAYKIPAGSLKPTLLVGDHILAKKIIAAKQGINRGDMIIFPFPEDTSKDFIKHVVATGGETIEIVNKKVIINCNLIEEPYIIHNDPNIIPKGQQPRDNNGPSMVPEDLLFVMGENRDQSYDSRFWGFVKKSDVTGIARSIYWSWDKENFLVRWNRIVKKIEQNKHNMIRTKFGLFRRSNWIEMYQKNNNACDG